MTRAILSLFSLDFDAYASYNVMALPVLAASLIIASPPSHPIRRRIMLGGALAILVLNLCYYIPKLIHTLA